MNPAGIFEGHGVFIEVMRPPLVQNQEWLLPPPKGPPTNEPICNCYQRFSLRRAWIMTVRTLSLRVVVRKSIYDRRSPRMLTPYGSGRPKSRRPLEGESGSHLRNDLKSISTWRSWRRKPVMPWHQMQSPFWKDHSAVFRVKAFVKVHAANVETQLSFRKTEVQPTSVVAEEAIAQMDVEA